MDTHTPTNQEVADAIGLTHSGVSRIRSGNRLPSIAKMRQIEAAFGWSFEDQANAREKGMLEYAREFNLVLAGTRRETSREAIPA